MTIKEINTQIRLLNKQVKVLDLKMDEFKEERKKTTRELTDLHNKLTSATAKPVVTEHAILRYIEIQFKIDINEIKNKILSEETLVTLKTLGLKTGKIKTDDFTIVIKDNQIVTLIKE